ncbi:hypothetical protein [Lysobacter sp. 22409]|uniref:hypothetical protein n=1 Tax=Lysobacter sp. 22409 TaxID=3453917 RepID=UPI003F87E998
MNHDDTVFLSTRTRNQLLIRNIRTMAQMQTAIESDQLRDVGPKALAEVRRLLGLDPPLVPEVIGSTCPRCGGDSGYRVSVQLAQVREYGWRGDLIQVSAEQLKTESQLVCRDCDHRLALPLPHRRGDSA